tara:strand:+ start:916 stop:1986 length:1071 start_codon:yes stop_codon:yes gene_type:complete
MQVLKKSFFSLFSIFLLIILIIFIDVTLTYLLNIYEKKVFIKHPVYHHTFGKNKVFYKNGIKYITDSYGFRNSSVKNDQKEYKKSILFIGDSFTEGIGLNFEDTFVGIIKKSLLKENIKVLNAARSSYSPVIYYKKIKFLIENEKIKFDEAIIFLDISDVEDESKIYKLDKNGNVISRNLSSEINYNQLGDQKLRVFLHQNTTIIYFTSKLINNLLIKKKKGKFDDLISLDYQRDKWTINEKSYNEYGKNGTKLMLKYMDMLKKTLDKHNIKMTVAVYPWPSQVYYEDLDSIHVRIWKNWSNENNIKFINFFPTFVKKGVSKKEKNIILEKFYIPYDVHFNKTANQMIAENFLKNY